MEKLDFRLPPRSKLLKTAQNCSISMSEEPKRTSIREILKEFLAKVFFMQRFKLHMFKKYMKNTLLICNE